MERGRQSGGDDKEKLKQKIKDTRTVAKNNENLMKLFKNVPELFIEMLEIHNSDITNNINVLQNAFQWFGSAIWGIQKGGGFNLKGGFMGRLGQLSKSLIETSLLVQIGKKVAPGVTETGLEFMYSSIDETMDHVGR